MKQWGGDDDGWSERNEAAKLVRNLWEDHKMNQHVTGWNLTQAHFVSSVQLEQILLTANVRPYLKKNQVFQD